MTYGIPVESFPLTPDYKIKNKNHLEMVDMLVKAESIAEASSALTLADTPCILLPTRRDVLFGKGKPIQFSPGNQRLSLFVESLFDEYHNDSLSKSEKTALLDKIVDYVKSRGVRFLSKETGVWQEVTDDLARSKVSQLFRSMKASSSGSSRRDSLSSHREDAFETFGEDADESEHSLGSSSKRARK